MEGSVPCLCQDINQREQVEVKTVTHMRLPTQAKTEYVL